MNICSSLLQATALRLQQEILRRESLLEEATWRVDHGEPPNEESWKEWSRLVRKSSLLADSLMGREEELMLAQPTGLIKSTAEPRPTAYIPEEMFIPKPYGNLAPFKPTQPGTTMRHIRIPNPKSIEI